MALQEGIFLFKSEEGALPGVKRVFVVMIDKKSVSTAEQIKRATLALSNKAKAEIENRMKVSSTP